MEFCLHYYGKLKSKDNAKGKHKIRSTFHNQIRNICHSDAFSDSFKPDWDNARNVKERPMFLEFNNKRWRKSHKQTYPFHKWDQCKSTPAKIKTDPSRLCVLIWQGKRS